MVEDKFSIALMFSTIHLRLEGKVPLPLRNRKLELGSEQHFTFQVTVTLEAGKVPPPPRIEIGLNMNAKENKSFHLRSASAFSNLPPFPAPDFMPEKETCKF